MNEDTGAVVEMAKKDSKTKSSNIKDIEFFNGFIIGQGSLYVLEDRNKVKTDNKIVTNGPEYIKRLWNTREIQPNAVKELLDNTAGGTLIYSEFQQYALTIAITKSLLNGTTLAEHESGKFPRVVLANDTDGDVLIVNGHHRIEADKKVHENLLHRLTGYKKNLHGYEVPGDYDNNILTQSREQVAELEEALWELGQWGAVFLDKGRFFAISRKLLNNESSDAILADPRKEEIKAYFSRNPVHFHYPDNAQDLLHLLLKSVQGMDMQKGFDFLEGQLQRSDKAAQAQLRRILKNPSLLFIFSDLITIPMFEKLKLINYRTLSDWRYIVPCWLSVFMDFARDSYHYLAFPPSQQINSILDIKVHNSSKTAYTFGFLDTHFHDIIDEAYKTHLAKAFIGFGCPDKLMVNGVEQDNWEESFSSYQKEILERFTAWVTSPNRPKKYRGHLNALVKRVTYILNDAYKEYPYISKLKAPLPLACATFIRDIGKSLNKNEMGILEVSYQFMLSAIC
jgi:hypothetical protein